MPSTTDLILEWDRRRPRSKQQTLGMSELGGCRRRAGYVLAGTAPTNPGGSVQAAMGSAIHDAIADILTELGLPGGSHEKEVKFAGLLGHYDRVEDGDTVIDVKTTSSRWLEHIKLHGPGYQHIWQVSCYAAALRVAGTPIKKVRIDYLARDTGEEWQWAGLFDPRHVRDALAWLDLVCKSDLQMLPRDYEPESAFCRGCRFLQVCWDGAVDGRDPMSVLFVEDPDAEKWAQKLWDAREQLKELKKEEAKAKRALDALRPDQGYGRVQVGDTFTLDFRERGIWFVSGAAPVPATGYSDGEAA